MKLLTFQAGSGALHLGALRGKDESTVVDLTAGAAEIDKQSAHQLDSMLALIEGGAAALGLAREVVSAAERSPSKSWGSLAACALKWKSPLPVPPQLRDCLMFEEHLLNSYSRLRETLARQSPDPQTALADLDARGLYRVPQVWYELPVYYKANRFSFIGTDEDIVWPTYTEKLDFELEYACVIGARTKDVSPEKAGERIFGYTIFNDVSARDVQAVEMQAQLGPSKGKDFDTGNVLGPCIVTADEVDPSNMTMIARVNGEEWCRGNSGSAYWTFPEVISHMSRCETLVPGELIGSGTVGGGCGLEHGRFLNPGDVIELEVQGIGILRNRVVRKDM